MVSMSELQIGDNIQIGISFKTSLLQRNNTYQWYNFQCLSSSGTKFSILYSNIYLATSDGSLTYSEVISFVEKQHALTTMFKSITTSFNNTVTLTGNHLIYARRSSVEKFIPKWVYCFKFFERLPDITEFIIKTSKSFHNVNYYSLIN